MRPFTNIVGLIFIAMISISFQTDDKSKSVAAGKEVYQEYCMLCHKVDGMGKKDMIPPLAGSDFLTNTSKTIHAIKYGMKGEVKVNGKTYNSLMASQNLSDEEVKDVTNYILNSWGNFHKAVIRISDVASVKK